MTTVNSVGKNRHIFIGWDNREAIGSIVCKFSLQLNSADPKLSIQYVNQKQLRKEKLYYRKSFTNANGQYFDSIDNKPFSTEFSFTRFLVPEICRQQHLNGWALFLDGDIIVNEDINKLFDLADEKYAVMCVKFNWLPDKTDKQKMDGMIQTRYNKKLWSSMMLFNLNHPAVKKLDHIAVNQSSGSYLHKFQWVDDKAIGALPESWNYVPEVSSGDKINAIHYTKGGPWFREYREGEYAEVWLDYLNTVPKNFIINELM
jgi:lipopolysaccharide biosynthesis glycosyltransferase